jgi:hypothetical protein
VNKPSPGWRGDAGGQIGGSQAMLVDDQILAVGEHQVLALDQKTGKTGYAWFRGTQMTFSGSAGFMANGKAITAIDRDAHARSTQERHAPRDEGLQTQQRAAQASRRGRTQEGDRCRQGAQGRQGRRQGHRRSRGRPRQGGKDL